MSTRDNDHSMEEHSATDNRDQHNEPARDCSGNHHHCCAPAAGPLASPQALHSSSGGTRTFIRIMQMDCPTEEALIRKKLSAMPTVINLEFNLMQRILIVEHAPGALESVLDAVRSLGFQPEIALAQNTRTDVKVGRRTEWYLVGAGVAAVLAEAVSWIGWPPPLSAALALLAVFASGLTTYKKGWIALRNGNLNINALMSIAVTGALVLGQWPEAAMVMVLFSLAELIEAKSLDRARHAIEGLMKLAPEQAMVQQADGTWLANDASSVTLGSIVRVKPGEKIALDGEIIRGRSTVNQAPITGESLPVDKAEGDSVFAGTINESGSFDFRVTATASTSTLARIIHAVEEAQGAKAPTQRFVDQFARVYTPIVFAIAVILAIAPPILLAGSWHDWIYKGLVMLVIACPCALVISTPVTIVSGLAAAARHGILIKGGAYLEDGRNLAWLALDKTGTITHGKPVQTDFELLADESRERCAIVAASLAGHSDHPVSLAILQAADGLGIPHESVEHFSALPGQGVRGVIEGKTYCLGNHRLVHEISHCSPELEVRLTSLERQGKTVVVLADDREVLALFAVADTVKDSSRAAIEDLHRLGVRTMMLTGDNPHTAAAIAQQVGIDEARGNQLPEDKLRAVESLIADGKVGMVGDGINDAPALARANIGFAMGAMGTDTAIETADVALMDDDLRKIPRFIRLSRQTAAILKQNIVFALGIKAIFLMLTLAGGATLWMAVFADMGASLLVIANGMRLLNYSLNR